MPVPLLKVKKGYFKFEDATPQQRLENKSDDHFTGEEGASSDSGINSTDSDLQETLPDLNASKQSAPYSCYTAQAQKGLNTACCDDTHYLCELCRNDYACYSYTQNSYLNADDLDYLNQAYEFYVNDVVYLNSNKCSFLINF